MYDWNEKKQQQHRIDLYMNLVHGPFMMNEKKTETEQHRTKKTQHTTTQ